MSREENLEQLLKDIWAAHFEGVADELGKRDYEGMLEYYPRFKELGLL